MYLPSKPKSNIEHFHHHKNFPFTLPSHDPLSLILTILISITSDYFAHLNFT